MPGQLITNADGVFIIRPQVDYPAVDIPDQESMHDPARASIACTFTLLSTNEEAQGGHMSILLVHDFRQD